MENNKENEWLDRWAFARYDLRLSEEEFWNLSFEQLAALRNRYLYNMKMQNWFSAQICAVIVNDNRKKGGRAFKPKDFMLNYPELNNHGARSEEYLLNKVMRIHNKILSRWPAKKK